MLTTSLKTKIFIMNIDIHPTHTILYRGDKYVTSQDSMERRKETNKNFTGTHKNSATVKRTPLLSLPRGTPDSSPSDSFGMSSRSTVKSQDSSCFLGVVLENLDGSTLCLSSELLPSL